MELLLTILGVILLCFGLSFLFRQAKKTQQDHAPDKPLKQAAAEKKPAPCPLCSSLLKAGERVKSSATPLANGAKLLRISGCPHCLYGEEKRICPICFAELTKDEILAAKMTLKNGTNNVKIFGCSRCGGIAAEWT